MKHFALVIAITALFTGCVAPGSSVGRIGLKAHCEANESSPKELRVVLTKEYGLGGLDRYFGKPEDYGHRDIEMVASATDGRYRAEFAVVYHIDFWMIPPLGPLPRHPPAPVYWLQIADSPEEVYLAGFDKRGLRYRVFDRLSRKEKKDSDARWKLADGRYAPEPTSGGKKIWYLEFTLKGPNQALVPTPMSVTPAASAPAAPATGAAHL
jgi:hypothetical protein